MLAGDWVSLALIHFVPATNTWLTWLVLFDVLRCPSPKGGKTENGRKPHLGDLSLQRFGPRLRVEELLCPSHENLLYIFTIIAFLVCPIESSSIVYRFLLQIGFVKQMLKCFHVGLGVFDLAFMFSFLGAALLPVDPLAPAWYLYGGTFKTLKVATWDTVLARYRTLKFYSYKYIHTYIYIYVDVCVCRYEWFFS